MYEEDQDRQDWYSTGAAPERSTPSRSAETEPLSSPLPSLRPADPSHSYPDAYWTEKESPPPPKKKRPAWVRPLGISLFIVLLIIATALIFADNEREAQRYEPLPGFDFGFGDRPEDFEDFRDFFDSYYTSDGSGKNSIPAASTGTGATLPLSPEMGEELSLKEVYAKCAPSVVAIKAITGMESYSWGSGVIFREDGYIVTNAHMLEGASSVTVTLFDDREMEAGLVGLDSVSDLAVLKIDARNLTAAEFVDSSYLAVGEEVIAIGNPLGEDFRGTMTNGIISAIERSVSYNGHSMTLMQTNAAINEGNSGGPLINLAGQVVGITNMKMMSYYSSIEGIGFAIPSSTIKTVSDALIEAGAVTGRPVIGVTLGSVPTAAADYYDLPEGLYVDEVSKGSDAEKKGVQVGDIITAVNGEKILSVYDVSQIKEGLKVGDSITLTIFRAGETFDVEVKLVEAGSLN